jgi:hypothetical protein
VRGAAGCVQHDRRGHGDPVGSGNEEDVYLEVHRQLIRRAVWHLRRDVDGERARTSCGNVQLAEVDLLLILPRGMLLGGNRELVVVWTDVWNRLRLLQQQCTLVGRQFYGEDNYVATVFHVEGKHFLTVYEDGSYKYETEASLFTAGVTRALDSRSPSELVTPPNSTLWSHVHVIRVRSSI